MECSVLTGCDLSGVNLLMADVALADMRGADLSSGDLRGVTMRRANLMEARLVGVQASPVQIVGAKTQRWPAHFDRARFDNAVLRGGDFHQAEMSGAVFTGADLRHQSRLVPCDRDAVAFRAPG